MAFFKFINFRIMANRFVHLPRASFIGLFLSIILLGINTYGLDEYQILNLFPISCVLVFFSFTPFLVGNCYAFDSLIYRETAFYFIGQSVLLNLISKEINSFYPTMLAFYPVSMALITYSIHHHRRVNFKLGLIFFATHILSFPYSSFSSEMAGVLIPYMALLAVPFLKKENLLLASEQKGLIYNKERFFFHDIVNHIHGPLLYLKNKSLKGSGLDAKECEEMARELENIQTLFKSYFKLDHKEIKDFQQYKTYQELRAWAKRIIPFYGRTSDVKIFETISENLLEEESNSTFIINSFIFQRVFINLIKNCTEASGDEIEVIFDKGENFIKIKTKNNFQKWQRKSYELGAKIASRINTFNEESRGSGVGLESVTELCEQVGGSFNFSIENNYWQNEVELPFIVEKKYPEVIDPVTHKVA